jgi:ABC-type multidrug transport system fused ATPase/permease subunit
MMFRRRLSGLFASQAMHNVFLFFGIMSLAAAILLVGATIAAAFTGDWNLPGRVAAFILFVALVGIFIFAGALLILAFWVWPFLVVVILIWAAHVIHMDRSKKRKDEDSSNEQQPGRG